MQIYSNNVDDEDDLEGDTNPETSHQLRKSRGGSYGKLSLIKSDAVRGRLFCRNILIDDAEVQL